MGRIKNIKLHIVTDIKYHKDKKKTEDRTVGCVVPLFGMLKAPQTSMLLSRCVFLMTFCTTSTNYHAVINFSAKVQRTGFVTSSMPMFSESWRKCSQLWCLSKLLKITAMRNQFY